MKKPRIILMIALLFIGRVSANPEYDPAACAQVLGTLDIHWEAVAGAFAPCTGIEFTDGALPDAADGSVMMSGTSVSDGSCIGVDSYTLTMSPDGLSLTGGSSGMIPMNLTRTAPQACFVGHWVSGTDDYLAHIAAAPFGAGIGGPSGFVVSTTSDSDPGSLRQAIIDANASPGPDRIVFDIPESSCSSAGVCEISVLSDLPAITEAVTIDGTSQPRFGTAPENVCATSTRPSYMRVQLTGDSFSINHLTLESDELSVVRGLSIGRGNFGIHIRADAWIYCNHLGVDATGATEISLTNSVCYHCQGSVNDGGLVGTNADGANDIAERNVIAGSFGVNQNAGAGLDVAGNYFGLGADGIAEISVGQCIFARQSASDSTYGSDLDSRRDEIERNIFGACNTGIQMDTRSTAGGNTIAGNWFGLNAAGGVVSSSVGIQLSGETPAVRVAENRFAGMADAAIMTEGVAVLAVNSDTNCISGNAAGLRHAGADSAQFDFTNNWWGDASGPSGVGPGTGDAIDQGTEMPVIFDPWLTEEPVSCRRRLLFGDGFEGETITENLSNAPLTDVLP